MEIYNAYVSSNAENCENQPGSNGYGVWNKVRERILELPATINMTVGNTLFTKRASYLEKHGYGMIMFVTVFLRSINYGRSRNGNTKGKYLKAKKKTGRAVYQAKYKAERKRFGNVKQRDEQKCDLYNCKKNGQNLSGFYW